MSDFDSLINIDAVLEQERKEKQALTMLLNKQREKKEHLLAIRLKMGSTDRSFVTGSSLEWIAQKVRFATELPMFKERKDKDGNISLTDRLTIDIIQQRKPDWRRQYPMALYLAERKNHKFPPLLLAVTQEWVDDDKSDKWGPDGRALADSISAQPLDSDQQYFSLHIGENDWVYALDGQHRLMAIKGLRDLVSEGALHRKSFNGSPTSRMKTLDEVVQASNGQVTASALQALLSERIGMEIVPAVLKGETRKQALRRLRSMFVHVNRTAKPLTTGELALLDEDNGFSVIARLLMVEHPLLKGRVEVKKGQLAEKSPMFTTLETLESVARDYLSQIPIFKTWIPEGAGDLPVRPDEDSLDEAAKRLSAYFDRLQELPSHIEMMNAGPNTDKIVTHRSTTAEGDANILFRPIGQVAMARAVGVLMNREHHPVTLNSIIELLKKKEKTGQLRCDVPNSPWLGPVLNPVDRRINRKGTELCADLLVHLLGGGTPDEKKREGLRAAFAASRRVGDKDNNRALNLVGNEVNLDDLDLPAPW
jgi:DGQHR domain-containing protein